MRTNLVAAVLASMGVTATGGCGGGDPSCETAIKHLRDLEPDAIDADDLPKMIGECQTRKWSGAMRRCVAKAKSLVDAAGCENTTASSGSRGRRSEAELNLVRIGKAAGTTYIETASFPQVTVPLTPARPCCEGPGKKCPANAADWNGVAAWDELDFELTEPSYFQYSYASEKYDSYVATAVGDLDCDGVTVTYELRGKVVDGQPQVELIKPDRPD